MAIANHLRELVDSFSELTAQHVRLARLELQEDAAWVGARVGVIAALAPLILVGYCFLCAAAAFGLAGPLGLPWALFVVGLVNLVGGGAGIAWAVNQLKDRKVMARTLAEVETTSAMVLRSEAPRSK